MSARKKQASSTTHLKKFDLSCTALFPLGWVSILVIAVSLASPELNHQDMNETRPWAAYTSKRTSSSSSPSLSSTCKKEAQCHDECAKETNENSLCRGSQEPQTCTRVRHSRQWPRSERELRAAECAIDFEFSETLAVSSPPPSAGTAPEASAISLSVQREPVARCRVLNRRKLETQAETKFRTTQGSTPSLRLVHSLAWDGALARQKREQRRSAVGGTGRSAGGREGARTLGIRPIAHVLACEFG
jgi:hypothetical protein